MAPVPSPSLRLTGARRRFNDIQSSLAVAQNGSPPRAVDWLLTGLFLLLALGESLTDLDRPMAWVELAAAVVAIIGVPWRRTAPPVAMVASVFIMALFSRAAADDIDFGLTLGAVLALAVSLYGLVRWQAERPVFIGIAVFLVVEAVGVVLRESSFADLVANVSFWLMIAGAATVMRYRQVLRINQIEQARLTERNVLARELHDSVAHYVSAIAVQAQAAQFVAKNDPGAASKAMAEVEQTANRAIDEMRRMVGVLRTNDDIARTVAATSLLELIDPSIDPPVLIAGDHDLSRLSPPVAAAVFRVAQESVTNARKHGNTGTYINVECEISPTEVFLNVVNDGVHGRPSRSGYGLIGMEERVRTLEGHIEAGPAPGGRWSVVARIPREKTNA